MKWPRKSRAGWGISSCATRTDGGRCTERPGSSRTIRTGAISSCSTNTSTAITARGSARATRPDGPVSCRFSSTCFRPERAGRCWNRERRKPLMRRTSRQPPRRAIGGHDMAPAYPSLYQINTRVLMTQLSEGLRRPAMLDEIPDAELDRIAALGFDWVWLLSVWSTGPAGRRVSREHSGWRHEFQDTLPDLRDEDIAGSGFAITGYTVHPALGDAAALARI